MKLFPGKDLDQIYEPDWEKMNHAGVMIVFNGVVVVSLTMISGGLVYSGWRYGCKKSMNLVSFYLIAALSMVMNLTMASLVIYLINFLRWFLSQPENQNLPLLEQITRWSWFISEIEKCKLLKSCPINPNWSTW